MLYKQQLNDAPNACHGKWSGADGGESGADGGGRKQQNRQEIRLRCSYICRKLFLNRLDAIGGRNAWCVQIRHHKPGNSAASRKLPEPIGRSYFAATLLAYPSHLKRDNEFLQDDQKIPRDGRGTSTNIWAYSSTCRPKFREISWFLLHEEMSLFSFL